MLPNSTFGGIDVKREGVSLTPLLLFVFAACEELKGCCQTWRGWGVSEPNQSLAISSRTLQASRSGPGESSHTRGSWGIVTYPRLNPDLSVSRFPPGNRHIPGGTSNAPSCVLGWGWLKGGRAFLLLFLGETLLEGNRSLAKRGEQQGGEEAGQGGLCP
jgi:drug/metabolite transporter superfamily protein YnfA